MEFKHFLLKMNMLIDVVNEQIYELYLTVSNEKL